MELAIERESGRQDTALREADVWPLLCALAARAGVGQAVTRACGVRLNANGELEEVGLGHGWLDVRPDEVPAFEAMDGLRKSVRQLLDLYLPLCVGEASNELVLGHVGQSLDGQIATSTGASNFITGQQDLVHTHRLRALFDVVMVGRATVTHDDPRLTTRLVAGKNPTRVVVDPDLRTPVDRRLFRDGEAPTLVFCARDRQVGAAPRGMAEVVGIASASSVLPPEAILAELRWRGFRRIFIEGGGVTVSHFLQAQALKRLHIAISPIIVGQGRPGLALARIDALDQALRPRVRKFALGEDMLFDCAF